MTTTSNLTEYRKKYYQEHKEILKAKSNETRYCEVCERHIKKNTWSKHIKSKKHTLLKMKKKEQEPKNVDEEISQLRTRLEELQKKKL